MRALILTPLEIALRHAMFNKDLVTFLLGLGADPNIYGEQSLLNLYIDLGDLDNIVGVLDHGAGINKIDDRGNTPLHNAINNIPISETQYTRMDYVNQLLQYLQLPQQPRINPKIYNIVECLICRGSDLNIVNRDEKTPLIILTERNLEHILDPIKEPEV